jgi:methionyl aminopeptidase
LLKNDILLKEGMVLAVEPMVNMGKAQVKTLADGWTVITRDKKCSAHFEHTIAVVKDGSEVLTKDEQ